MFISKRINTVGIGMGPNQEEKKKILN